MVSAFWYLLRHSARNRLIRQMNRMKEPRYAISLLVGLTYLWFFLFHQQRPAPASANTNFTRLVPLLGSIGLFLAVARWWLFGGNQAALTFTPGEIQFLFPAPISRHSLIRWKLLRSQLRILLNTLVWIVLTRRSRPPIPLPLYVMSLWVMFSTLSMHRLGATLVRAGISSHWKTGLRRQVLPILLVGGAALGLVLTVFPHWLALRQGCCGLSFWSLLDQVFQEPAARVILYPFRLLLAAVAAATVTQWLQSMVPALVLLALHFLWVTRSQAVFEEAALRASAEAASRMARRTGEKGAAPSGRRAGRLWIRLAPTGWPGMAIIWKNLIAITRGSLSRGIIVVVAVGVAMAAVMSGNEHRAGIGELIGTAALGMAAVLAFLGPIWIRNDLRGDMPYLSLLRSYPLRGRSLVAAEVAGSAITLTALQCFLMVVGLLGLRGTPQVAQLPPLSVIIVITPIGLALLNTIGMTVQNAGVLLFPAWVRFDAVRPGGFETMGQNILSSIFTILLTAISLALPVLTGFGAWWLLNEPLGRWAWLPAAGSGGIVILLEAFGLLTWLGRVFDRTESIT
ncbi:MAG: putative ABC exporter domain-containing protein [Gemmatimonadota bacterium]